jgi:hypothetical protein
MGAGGLVIQLFRKPGSRPRDVVCLPQIDPTQDRDLLAKPSHHMWMMQLRILGKELPAIRLFRQSGESG